MEGPLGFMCSIGKTFFLTKVTDKQLRLKSLASFTNRGPDTYVLLLKYCYTSVVSHLHLMISSPPQSEQSIINTTWNGQEAGTGLFM